MAHSKGNQCSEHRVVSAVVVPGHDRHHEFRHLGLSRHLTPQNRMDDHPVHPRALIKWFKVAPNTSHLHVFGSNFQLEKPVESHQDLAVTGQESIGRMLGS